MKTKLILFITIFILMFEIYYAQFIPHKASITPSKDAVLSSETFTVTYSLTEVEGNVYIGIQDGYFEIIGNDRWEGYVKMGETVNVTFTVKFKEKIKPYLYSEKVSLGIGFSYRPFGDMVRGGEFKSILISLSDFKDFKQEGQRVLKDSTKSGNDSIKNLDLYLIPYDTPSLRKEVIPDTNSIKQWYPNTSFYDLDVPEKNNSSEEIEIGSTYLIPIRPWKVKNEHKFELTLHLLENDKFNIYPIENDEIKFSSDFLGLENYTSWTTFKNNFFSLLNLYGE